MDKAFELVIQLLADAKSITRARAEDLFAASKLFPNVDTAGRSTRDREKELAEAPRKLRTPEESQRILADDEAKLIKLRLNECDFSCTLTFLISSFLPPPDQHVSMSVNCSQELIWPP